MTKARTKPVEIMLATWPHCKGYEYFGDRVPTLGSDVPGCGSMWLSFRVFDDGTYNAYVHSSAIQSIGMWIWWSHEHDRCYVEFRAHDIHSATLQELARISRLIKRLNRRLPNYKTGKGYGAYAAECVRSAGIRRSVNYEVNVLQEEKYRPVDEALEVLCAHLDYGVQVDRSLRLAEV